MTELCTWIADHGGPIGLTIIDIFAIVDSYMSEIPPAGYAFIPTLQNVLGIIDYYFGFDGDAKTGCDFFPDQMIRNLVFPLKVIPWMPFDISYDCYNNTEQSAELWGCIIEEGTGRILDGWQEIVAPGNFKHSTYIYLGGISSILHARIEVGFIMG